jgi:general secretion pathway protein D
VISDPRTNSLIITAGRDTMQKVLAWIADLDIETDPRGDIHVYRLRNSRASGLSRVLTDVMEGATARSTSRGGGGGAAGGGATGGGGLSRNSGEQPVSIIADDNTNSLIITASKTRYAQVLEIIRKLDIRPAQVMIQAALIEVSQSLGEVLGVELTAVNIDAADDTFFGISSFGLTDLLDTDGDGFPDVKALPDPLATGLTGGIVDPKDFPLPFVLQALADSSEANVLSLPSILTNDNQPATISAQDTVPFTQTNQGQNSDQTTLGGSEDAGITLTISPTISAGGYLRLNIDLQVSSFSADSADPNLPPPSLERTIEATVTIPDGHTMIIGGVMTNDSSRAEEKVPILGDLPLIGFLFRSSRENASKTNLYFFLTPYIISDDFATLDELTRLAKEEAAKLGGQVEMLNRFHFLDQDDVKTRELTEELLERAFELPAYASVADEVAPPEDAEITSLNPEE